MCEAGYSVPPWSSLQCMAKDFLPVAGRTRSGGGRSDTTAGGGEGWRVGLVSVVNQHNCETGGLHACCTAQYTSEDDFYIALVEGLDAMRRPNQDEPSRNSNPNGTSERAPLAAWLPVLAALGIMVTGCLSTFLVLQLDEFRPKVGDIVAFKPGSEDTDMWQMTNPAHLVSATGATQAACTLDPNVMADKGGSLIVEGREDADSIEYQVHWAGSRTTQTAGNCGASADLLVSRVDLQRLANAAGGFGVEDKGIVR